MDKKVTVGIAEDQQLFLKSLGMLVDSYSSFKVVVEAPNGRVLLDEFQRMPSPPDIALIDVNMPIMDGVEVTKQLRLHYPLVKAIALSIKDDDLTIIKMIRAGCCAYLLKDMPPLQLEYALTAVYEKGMYNGDAYHCKQGLLRRALDKPLVLTHREIEFLQFAATDYTYKQIAAHMHLSEKTIDGYRENLFEKLQVQSRVGMVLEGIRQQFITI